jgi:hypothetical protein
MPENPVKDHRICERIGFNKRMIVELANGTRIEGETADISLGGILMHTDDEVNHGIVGEDAQLLVVLDDETLSTPFQCHIRRVQDHTIALELDRKMAAAFGKTITKGQFVR